MCVHYSIFMKSLFDQKKKFSFILWLGIILFALFTRFYRITQVPTSFAQDEMIYAIHAQSVAYTGTDLTGTWNPLSLTPVHPMFAELPTLFQAPFFLLPLPPVIAAKLPFILLSLATPLVIGGISWELFRNRKAAFFTVFLSLFNPWMWQFGRMGFDASWSLFFFSLGGYLFLRLENWKKLWSIIPLFIGFYQYQGHKLALVPWVIVFIFFALYHDQILTWKHSWKSLSFNWKKFRAPLLVFFVSLALFLFYAVVQLPSQGSATRISTMVTPNSEDITSKVNERHTLSLITPLNSLLINKYTIWGEEVLRRYSEVYNPKHLFLTSQYMMFNVWTHGLFYLLDAPLLILGVIALWKKKNVPLLLGLLFGLLTTVVAALVGNGNSYIFRTSLSLPLLFLIAGMGAAYLSNSWSKIFSVLFAFGYFGCIFLFGFEYFVRYPIYAAESQYFSDKILSQYVKIASDSPQEILVYTAEPQFTYQAIVFYNDLLRSGDRTKIQQEYRDETYRLGNLRLTDECVPHDLSLQPEKTIIVRTLTKSCDEEPAESENESVSLDEEPDVIMHTIAAIKDSGSVYTIFNDTVCRDFMLPRYLHISRLESFAMHELSPQEFCQTWIMD
jgi:hypothetical protein